MVPIQANINPCESCMAMLKVHYKPGVEMEVRGSIAAKLTEIGIKTRRKFSPRSCVNTRETQNGRVGYSREPKIIILQPRKSPEIRLFKVVTFSFELDDQ